MNGAAVTPQKYTDRELLDMRPPAGSDHATWREYHRILFEHGKLTPPNKTGGAGATAHGRGGT